MMDGQFPFMDVDEYRRLYPDSCKPRNCDEDEDLPPHSEPTFNTARTPAQVVQEFTMKTAKQIGIALFDEVEEIDQNTGIPEFTCHARLVKFNGSGKGRTKKIAKQIACYELLKSAVAMDRYLEFDIFAKSKAEAYKLLEKIKPVEDIEAAQQAAPVFENWIGKLSEFCVLNKLPQPEYEFEESGPPNQRLYTSFAIVAIGSGKQQASASGKKKKESKADAARKLIEILQTQVTSLQKTMDQLEGKGAEIGAEDDDDEPTEGLLGAAGVNVSRAQTVEFPQKELEIVLADTTRFLSTFALYRELQQPSTRGKSQVLLTVQFSKAPPPPIVHPDGTVTQPKVDRDAPSSHNYVFGGEGVDVNAARDEAARAALVHLLTYKGPREVTPAPTANQG